MLARGSRSEASNCWQNDYDEADVPRTASWDGSVRNPDLNVELKKETSSRVSSPDSGADLDVISVSSEEFEEETKDFPADIIAGDIEDESYTNDGNYADDEFDDESTRQETIATLDETGQVLFEEEAYPRLENHEDGHRVQDTIKPAHEQNQVHNSLSTPEVTSPSLSSLRISVSASHDVEGDVDERAALSRKVGQHRIERELSESTLTTSDDDEEETDDDYEEAIKIEEKKEVRDGEVAENFDVREAAAEVEGVRDDFISSMTSERTASPTMEDVQLNVVGKSFENTKLDRKFQSASQEAFERRRRAALERANKAKVRACDSSSEVWTPKFFKAPPVHSKNRVKGSSLQRPKSRVQSRNGRSSDKRKDSAPSRAGSRKRKGGGRASKEKNSNKESKSSGKDSKAGGRESKASGRGRESKASGRGRESKASGRGRESNASGRASKASGRESKASMRDSKGSRRESKGSRRESKGSRRESKASGRGSKASGRESKISRGGSKSKSGGTSQKSEKRKSEERQNGSKSKESMDTEHVVKGSSRKCKPAAIKPQKDARVSNGKGKKSQVKEEGIKARSRDSTLTVQGSNFNMNNGGRFSREKQNRGSMEKKKRQTSADTSSQRQDNNQISGGFLKKAGSFSEVNMKGSKFDRKTLRAFWMGTPSAIWGAPSVDSPDPTFRPAKKNERAQSTSGNDKRAPQGPSAASGTRKVKTQKSEGRQSDMKVTPRADKREASPKREKQKDSRQSKKPSVAEETRESAAESTEKKYRRSKAGSVPSQMSTGKRQSVISGSTVKEQRPSAASTGSPYKEKKASTGSRKSKGQSLSDADGGGRKSQGFERSQLRRASERSLREDKNIMFNQAKKRRQYSVTWSCSDTEIVTNRRSLQSSKNLSTNTNNRRNGTATKKRVKYRQKSVHGESKDIKASFSDLRKRAPPKDGRRKNIDRVCSSCSELMRTSDEHVRRRRSISSIVDWRNKNGRDEKVTRTRRSPNQIANAKPYLDHRFARGKSPKRSDGTSLFALESYVSEEFFVLDKYGNKDTSEHSFRRGQERRLKVEYRRGNETRTVSDRYVSQVNINRGKKTKVNNVRAKSKGSRKDKKLDDRGSVSAESNSSFGSLRLERRGKGYEWKKKRCS